MINKCIDYLEQNGYYGDVDGATLAVINLIAFKATEQLCSNFSDKDGAEVPDDVFEVVRGLIEGEL